MGAPESLPPFTTAPRPPATPLSPRRRLLLLVGLGACAVVGLGVTAVTAWAGHAEPPAKERTVPTTREIVERLDRVSDTFPETREQRCTGLVAANVPLIDFDALVAFRKGETATPRVPELATVALTKEGRTTANDPTLARLGEIDHVAVLKTVAFEAPHASLGTPTAGHYEGLVVVFDLRNATPLCQTRIVAWSSRYAMEQGLSERAFRDDYIERIKTSLRESTPRLSPSLSLDL